MIQSKETVNADCSPALSSLTFPFHYAPKAVFHARIHIVNEFRRSFSVNTIGVTRIGYISSNGMRDLRLLEFPKSKGFSFQESDAMQLTRIGRFYWKLLPEYAGGRLQHQKLQSFRGIPPFAPFSFVQSMQEVVCNIRSSTLHSPHTTSHSILVQIPGKAKQVIFGNFTPRQLGRKNYRNLHTHLKKDWSALVVRKVFSNASVGLALESVETTHRSGFVSKPYLN
ncbi:hypothetical protein QE152_g35921 [Popillia japonica]|uniref:Uncharacterized protein n=1 Tax=Popillia japonica TaxID=7064 RepID=A0AAW1IEI4_POPJA